MLNSTRKALLLVSRGGCSDAEAEGSDEGEETGGEARERGVERRGGDARASEMSEQSRERERVYAIWQGSR